MTVTNVHKDPDALTMTITASSPPRSNGSGSSGPTRATRALVGPARLPGDRSSTTTSVGGEVTYYMTTARRARSTEVWWKVIAVDAPRRLEMNDGFANNAGLLPTETCLWAGWSSRWTSGTGRSVEDGPSHPHPTPTLEAMEQVLAMGQEEGMVKAIGQIEGILAGTASS